MDHSTSRQDEMINIDRKILRHSDIHVKTEAKINLKESIDKKLKKISEVTSKSIGRYIISFIPFLSWIRVYDWKKDFKYDLCGGTTVGFTNLSQSLASAFIIGVGAIHGLNSACFLPLIYVFFGSSRHLSPGSVLTLSIVVASTVSKYSTPSTSISVFNETLNETTTVVSNDGYRPLDVSVTLSFLAGIWLLIFSMLGLGDFCKIMSDQLMNGYICAICVIISINQVGIILGLKIAKQSGSFGSILTLKEIIMHIQETNFVTLAFGIGGIFLHVFGGYLNQRYKKKIKFPVPMELIIIIIAILISHFTKVETTHDVKVLGYIPKGFPSPTYPKFDLAYHLIPDSIILAICIFTLSYCYAEHFTKQCDTPPVSLRQELIAFGSMQIVGAFTGCIVTAAAFSRSKILVASGGRSQIATIISSLIMLAVISFFGPTLYSLPKCILAAIIISCLRKSIINIDLMKSLWKNSKYDLCTYMLMYFTTIITDPVKGIIIGFGFSLLILVIRIYRTDIHNLSQHKNTEIYIEASKDSDEILIHNSKVSIIKINNAINFISRSKIKARIEKQIYRLASYSRQKHEIEGFNNLMQMEKLLEKETNENSKGANEKKMIRNPGLIISFAAVSFIDYSGLETLKEIVDFARHKQVDLYICSCSGPVFNFLEDIEFFDIFPVTNIFVSIQDATHFLIQNYIDDVV